VTGAHIKALRITAQARWYERDAIDPERYPAEHATATRLFEAARAELAKALSNRPDHRLPPVSVVEIARRRGLHVETFPSGAVRITGPGVNLLTTNIDMVNVSELNPNIRHPRAPRY
jgi:hypothetical protein